MHICTHSYPPRHKLVSGDQIHSRSVYYSWLGDALAPDQTGHYEEEKNMLPIKRIEPLCIQAQNLIIIIILPSVVLPSTSLSQETFEQSRRHREGI